jgi:glycosyltransferase involved in cell wall biosynthesis
MGYHHPFDRAGLHWSLAQKIPQLFRAETNDYASDRSFMKRFVRDLLLRRLYRRSAAFCYIGQHSKGHYQRLGVPESRLFFSPYCVDETPFQLDDNQQFASLRADTRARMSIPENAHVLIYSGKLSERKGVDLIPKAVEALPESLRNNLHIIFLGDGTLRAHLETACSGIHAHFTGFQNQFALSAFYYAADALILPSRRSETWGLVVNEAMLHGLPCLVSDRVGCQPDLVLPGLTGEVFVSNNLQSLTQALNKLLSRLPDQTMALQCRQLARLYSATAAAKGVAQAWDSIGSNNHVS